MSQRDVSVVVPTFNRSVGLLPLIERLLDQEADGVDYDVTIVDNNSSDGTRALVEQAIARDATGRLNYIFESRQGVSHARNSGVRTTSAPIIAFLDDDGLPGRDWVAGMKRSFDTHPEADCIGGRVKAVWSVPRPAWLQDAHAGPIALQDRPQAAYVNAQNASACLLTANLGFRRSVFERIGGFSPDYPRNQDRELELRMWRAGMQGLYLPAMEVTVDVPPHRLTRAYHRRWQATTGHFHALMRFRDMVDGQGVLREESPHTRRLFGTPLFLYRSAAGHLFGWLSAAIRMRGSDRFYHETRLWYYLSFVRTRWRQCWTRQPTTPAARPIYSIHANRTSRVAAADGNNPHLHI